MASTRTDNFKNYLQNLLTLQGKKFLLAGETHGLDDGLNALIPALREIKKVPAPIVLVFEALPQIVVGDKRRAYTIEDLRKSSMDKLQLKLLEELVLLGVQVYGAENSYSSFILIPPPKSIKELYERLVKSKIFSPDHLKDFKKIIETDKYMTLDDLQLVASLLYSKLVDRLIRGNEVFSKCLAHVVHDCKDENTLGIFVGGVKHLVEVSREKIVFEPGMQHRVVTEYKKISGKTEATVKSCYVADSDDDPAMSYTPKDDARVDIVYAAISPVFRCPSRELSKSPKFFNSNPENKKPPSTDSSNSCTI